MEIELRDFRLEDAADAIAFAIEGMHFRRYTDNPLLVDILLGRYYLYLSLESATQAVAAYTEDGKLAGVLFGEFKGEKKKYRSSLRGIFLKCMNLLRYFYFHGTESIYFAVNERMLEAYGKPTDGEYTFLAVDPELRMHGIGERLLQEMEHREAGKRVFLFTDSDCSHPFFDHYGFQRVGEECIEMRSGTRKFPLECMLYVKELPESEGA